MGNRILQSQADLEAHLVEQIGFLERSAESFDTGFTDEAKRLAVTLRVLLQETPNSHSLLGQLGRLSNLSFCDSSIKPFPGSILPHAALAGLSISMAGVRHVAGLDGDDPSWFTWVDFKSWWNTSIFSIQGKEITRRSLVLTVANQDGGAHIDPALDGDYEKLSRRNALRRFTGPANPPVTFPELTIGDAELVSIRQITHEVLKTLKPGYERKPKADGNAIIGSIGLIPPTPLKGI